MVNDSLTSGPIVESVRLRNFKSTVSAAIEVKALTVLIGANSSGKSSLLQGLMALGQAAQVQGSRASFPLNGGLTDLGYFHQVKHLGSHQTEGGVGLGLTVRVPAQTGPREAGPFMPQREMSRTERARWNQLIRSPWLIEVDVEFSGQDHEDPASSLLRSIDMKSTFATGEELHVHLKRGRRPSRSIDSADVVGLLPRRRAVPDVVDTLRGFISFGGKKAQVIAVGLTGPLPSTFVSLRPEPPVLAARLLTPLTSHFYSDYEVFEVEPGAPTERPASESTAEVDRFVEAAIKHLVRAQASTSPDRLAPVPRLYDEVRASRAVWEAVITQRPKIERRIARGLKQGDRIPVWNDSPEAWLATMATSHVGRVLMGVKHLGGLRAAPQPLYPTSNRAQQGDIGRDGQYSAAVLYAWRDRDVDYFDRDGRIERVPLREAVRRWAGELQLFDNVTPHHQAALGIDLKVKQKGLEGDIEVTAVGLGVSQLLPVLVRCLLSRPGEVVLLEQPELHLHPASQLRLADFLLACAQSGRQLVVETHSEHLVNRLRLRAAEDKTDRVAQAVGLVFAERDGATGETTYDSVGLNPYGGLTEWPEGFMGEGVAEAIAILDAGLEKVEQEESN